MKEEAPEELIGADAHRALLVATGVIFPAEHDAAIAEFNQPMVGDGNAMGIASEILQDVFGAAEGPLGINDPVLPEKLPQETLEHFGIGQASELTVETQPASAEEPLQSRHKFASEQFAEHPYRKKESSGWANPV